MNRTAAALGALRGAISGRRALLRVALGIGADHGWIAGRALASALDSDQRKRAAAALLRDEHVVVRFRHGETSWAIPSGDLILADMLSEGRYETEELEPLLAWVSARRAATERSTIVEVGANVGTTTVPLCQHGHHVVAFEPIDRLRSLLIENLRDNGVLDRATVQALAIAEREAEVEMRVSDSGGSEIVVDSVESISGRRGAAYFSGRQAADERPNEVVTTRPLDAVLADLKVQARDVLLVWSDTEGAETGVIAGAGDLWAAGVPLWLEVWPVGLDEHGGLDEFLDTVRRHFGGYVDRDDLIRLLDRAPIRSLTELESRLRNAVGTESAHWSTDLLLVPASTDDVRTAQR